MSHQALTPATFALLAQPGERARRLCCLDIPGGKGLARASARSGSPASLDASTGQSKCPSPHAQLQQEAAGVRSWPCGFALRIPGGRNCAEPRNRGAPLPLPLGAPGGRRAWGSRVAGRPPLPVETRTHTSPWAADRTQAAAGRWVPALRGARRRLQGGIARGILQPSWFGGGGRPLAPIT